MDRTIVVLLRRRDVVLEAAGHHRPGGVHDAERAVAGLDVLRRTTRKPKMSDSCSKPTDLRSILVQIENGCLRRPLTRAVMPFFCRFLESWLSISPIRLRLRSASASSRCIDHRIGLRIERLEREVLELLAHLLHTHAAGERRIDVERLLGDAAARGRRHEFQRAHVVQAVGELDQQHADVVGDRQQQLAQVLGLLGLARHQFEPLQLGQALDQRADLVAEHLVDLGARRLGVLDGVVQQRRDDGGVVELEVGEDRRDFERMREIRIAGGARLRAVRLHGVDIGAVEQVLVGVRDCRTGRVRPDRIAASCANAAIWPSVTGDVGATATWWVAACICRALRRQYAHDSRSTFFRGPVGPPVVI